MFPLALREEVSLQIVSPIATTSILNPRKHKQRQTFLSNIGSAAGRTQLPKDKNKCGGRGVNYFSSIKVGFPNKDECYSLLRCKYGKEKESHYGAHCIVTL